MFRRVMIEQDVATLLSPYGDGMFHGSLNVNGAFDMLLSP